jgi:electron transfer flavoprotein alpha/beta subunit
MKILVAIKYAADYPNKINPYDAVAVEAALGLCKMGKAAEVVVASIGGNESQGILATALAMGADRAIFVCAKDKGLQRRKSALI